MTAAGETYRLNLQSNAQYHDLFNQGTCSCDITITTTDVSSYPAGTLVDRSFTFNGDTSGDTTDAIGYDIEDYGAPHLYYSFVAPTTTTVTLLCVGGGGFLPYVEVLDDSLWANPTDYGELAWVDQLGDGTTSPPSISLSLTAGRTYYLTVADWNFDTPGAFQLTIPDFVSVYQEEAASVTNRTAILSALVNPRGVSSTAHFEYGLDTSYGTSTTPQSIGSGSAFLAVQDSIADLTPGRVYYFRGVVSP